MLPLLPEYTVDQFDSRHRLVLVAAQRAKQLMQGAKPIGPIRFTKETTIALDEVLNKGIPYLRGKDARDAIKETTYYFVSIPRPTTTASRRRSAASVASGSVARHETVIAFWK